MQLGFAKGMVNRDDLKGGSIISLARLFVGVRLKRLMLRRAIRIALDLPQEENQQQTNNI